MYYQETSCYKRYMISNTLDPRFYKPIVNKFTDSQESTLVYQRPGASS